MKTFIVSLVSDDPRRAVNFTLERKSDIKHALTSYLIQVTITDDEQRRTIQKNIESCPVLSNPLEVIGFAFAMWPELNEPFDREPEPHPDPLQELRKVIES